MFLEKNSNFDFEVEVTPSRQKKNFFLCFALDFS